MQSDASAVPIWVILGARHGDNQQLLAIAEALDMPYRVIPVRFNAAAALPPVLLGASRLAWRSTSDISLAPPWPRAVLAAGRKSVSAALWIRRQSAGRTQLIHVNRPWAPLSWFDLIITTPQYAVPERVNVLTRSMPFMPLPEPTGRPLPQPLHVRAASMPRPWTLVMVGGDSRPLMIDEAAAIGLGNLVNEQVRAHGGSAWVLGSPRTRAPILDLIERTLQVPSHVVRWGQSENPYPALRETADRFVVTMDSATMLTEALLSGRTVVPFDLSVRPDWRWRLAAAWRKSAERAPGSIAARTFDAMRESGWLSSVRDLGLMRQALEAAGAFGGNGRARELAQRERSDTLARILELIQRP